MKSKEFIRIEYADTGYGMYRITDINENINLESMPEFAEMSNRHCNREILPNKWNDKTIKHAFQEQENKQWRFCFKSIENFKELIKDTEIELLKQYGFKIFKIRASNYIESPYQTIVELETIYQKIELI